MTKIDEFHPDRRQNLAESDKGSWFNQLSESEATSASSLNVSAVIKEKNNGNQKKAMLRESDFQKRVRIILRRRILHCTRRIFKTTLRHFLLGLF